MNITENSNAVTTTSRATTLDNGGAKQDRFFPSGAIAFFVSLVILCLAIWFGIYFLMLDRI